MPFADTTKILENGIVVSGDTQNRCGRFAVLVRNDRIIDIVSHAEPLKHQFPNAEVIDATGKILLPGFVDAHYHGESFLLRYISGTTPMARWEKDRRFQSAYRYCNETASREELETMYRIAYFNALKAGITCLADFGIDNLDFHPIASFEAMKRSELKGFIGLHNGDQVEKSRALQSPNIRFAVTITNEDDLTTYTLQTALRSADEMKIPLMVHLGETRRALETLKRNFHRTTTELLSEYHFFNLKVQLSHLSVLEGEDIAALASAKTPVIICPNSALLKEEEIPPVGEFLSRGLLLALGTDWGLPDPLTNVRSLVSLARSQNQPIPGPFDLLALCTRNGARALGMLDSVGTLEPGKKADIIFVDVADSRHGIGTNVRSYPQLLSSVLLECSAGDITDVMVNGNFFVREGTLLTYAEDDLLSEGEKLLGKLVPPLQHNDPMSQSVPEKQPAPIFNFETSEIVTEREDLADEGFRILKKVQDGVPPRAFVPPVNIEPPKPVDVPKTVIKKVFGEDDL
jgi:5-methylthioadenosine/S-adenosylhomocysteine deaminase